MMTYTLRIRHLEQAHENLKRQVAELQKKHPWNDTTIANLKKEKLRIKDQIAQLMLLERQEEDLDYVRAEADDY